MRILLLPSLLALTAVALPACGDDNPTGTLIVPFEIGVGVACSTLDVADVTVELWRTPEDGGVAEMIETSSGACDDGKITFNSVAAGNYEIRARGDDPNGITVVDNEGRDTPDMGEVLAGAENTADIVNLSPTPAKVFVRWQLQQDNFQAMCSEVSVAEFEVSVFENNGTKELYQTKLACDAAKDSEQKSYVRAADEARDIDGAELDTIKIAPLDAMGNAAGSPAIFTLAEPPGPGRTIRLTVTANCEGDTCDLTCASDPCAPDPA